MKRLLLRAATLFSLLLLAATLAIWLRSYWAAQYLGWSDRTQWRGVLSMQGLLRFEHGTYGQPEQGWDYVSYPVSDRSGLWPELNNRSRRGGPLKRLGIASSQVDYNFDGKNMRYSVYLPHWLIVLPLMLAPGVACWKTIRRHQAGRRAGKNLCVKCGYDLRATPECCPECGTIPA